MKVIIFVTLFLALGLNLLAQPIELDHDIFAQRRAEFIKKIDSNAVAIFPSKPEYLRNLDVEYPYRQESNFYYLSGFEEPESILLINPSAPKNRYVMYIRKRNLRYEVWEGQRAGIEGAMTTFRADTAIAIDDLKTTLRKTVKYDRPIYYTFGINPEIDHFVRKNFIERRSGGNWPIIDPAPILNQMRLIKNKGDWKMGLRRAIDISADAHVEVMRAIQPGMYEYEIQAIFEYIYRINGSPRNGYPCIVGSGPNATIFHYNLNNRLLKDGELILMDCAAEYGYYSADITRTVPTNGKFSQAQKDIYQLVLKAQKAAIEMVKPGVSFKDLDKKINEVFGNGLESLGLLKNKKESRMYSRHGFCHWIGLEVHDVGAYKQKGEYVPFEAGMVFTIEPGLYFRQDIFDTMKKKGYSETEIEKIRPQLERYMHIGVRIEDDILVTETGYVNLSNAVPREIEDIEKLMRQNPQFVISN
jgi:Xaa-Pro aminopeptidase